MGKRYEVEVMVYMSAIVDADSREEAERLVMEMDEGDLTRENLREVATCAELDENGDVIFPVEPTNLPEYNVRCDDGKGAGVAVGPLTVKEHAIQTALKLQRHTEDRIWVTKDHEGRSETVWPTLTLVTPQGQA